MFHAVSLMNEHQALGLAYRYSRIEAGMQREELRPSLTAVVDREIAMLDDKMQFSVNQMKEGSVAVRPVGDMVKIAGEVRWDLGA
jgi:hypothetical protein